MFLLRNKNDDRYEDGVGDVSGSGGHKRDVSWNKGVLLYLDDVQEVKDALQDRSDRMGGK